MNPSGKRNADAGSKKNLRSEKAPDPIFFLSFFLLQPSFFISAIFLPPSNQFIFFIFFIDAHRSRCGQQPRHDVTSSPQT